MYMEDSEPKWVNHILNIIGVNSLRFGDLHTQFELLTSYLAYTKAGFDGWLTNFHSILLGDSNRFRI